MKEYFIVKYALFEVEFFRDYVSLDDIWYNVAISKEGTSVKYRMHNNKDRTWKITGTRIPPYVLRLEQDFADAIGRNEVSQTLR